MILIVIRHWSTGNFDKINIAHHAVATHIGFSEDIINLKQIP